MCTTFFGVKYLVSSTSDFFQIILGNVLNVLFMPCNLTRLQKIPFPLSLLVQISNLCDSSMLMICILIMQSIRSLAGFFVKTLHKYLHIQNVNLVFINLVLAVFSATQVESRGLLLLHAPSGCGHFKILATSLDIYI